MWRFNSCPLPYGHQGSFWTVSLPKDLHDIRHLSYPIPNPKVVRLYPPACLKYRSLPNPFLLANRNVMFQPTN
jgi:hypothetical protein